jgi:hypothetical protein
MVHMDAPLLLNYLDLIIVLIPMKVCIYPNLIQKIFWSTTKNILNILKFNGMFPNSLKYILLESKISFLIEEYFT